MNPSESNPNPPVVRLSKHHGLGNDFLVAIEPSRALDPTDAVRWCDRKQGIGADGLIEVRRLSDNPDGASIWAMTLWNADGSRAEISGNGLRCVGQALVRSLGLEGDQSFLIRTDAGLRQVHVRPDRRARGHRVRVDMGDAKEGLAPSEQWADLGIVVEHQIGVDLGNPHLVAVVDQPEAVDLGVVGPAIEADYPEGINVHLIRVENRSTISLAVWERGAGLTGACGTGACAAAWAAHRWGLVDDAVKVKMAGGAVEVNVEPSSLILTGPATHVADVEIEV